MNIVWGRKNHFFWKRDKSLDQMPMKELVTWTRFLCDLWLLEAESSGNAYLELGTLHQELAYTLSELLEVMRPDPKKEWSSHFPNPV
jgi:hypothetical protein